MRNPFYAHGEPYEYRSPNDPQRLAEERVITTTLEYLQRPRKTSEQRWIEGQLKGMTDGYYEPASHSWTFYGPSGSVTLTALDFAARAMPCPPTV